ncbi:MAG: hypothetical protein KAW89_03035 [Armatimonadetes bacterium]|nr:hypothetical protein [Armatimonadota bacterium]
MTHRERFLRTYRFQQVDHVPDIEFGYWNETLPRWHGEGLPQQIDSNEMADKYFGFMPFADVPVSIDWPILLPQFETRVIEETDRHKIIINEEGVTCQVHKDGTSSIAHCLDWSLKTPDDWPAFRERLDPDAPARYPDNWDEIAEKAHNSTVPVRVACGSLFGVIRDWMGFQNSLIAIMEQRDWIEEMMEHLTLLYISVLEQVSAHVHIDCGAFWEDMCFGGGPMISPKLFRELMTPRYKRVTDVLKRTGCDIFIVDSDGDMTQLVEHWIAGGVNCMFPLEIAAGTDPCQMRECFGREVLLMGGVNKRELAKDKQAIRAEVDRLVPLVEQGGYIPHVDHRVPPDVSYENYLYYLQYKREALGIPDPWADGPPDPDSL